MPRRSMATSVWLLLAVLIYGCHWTQSRKTGGEPHAPAGGVEVGQVAPDLDGTDLDGERLHLADYRGRVVVLSFWSRS